MGARFTAKPVFPRISLCASLFACNYTHAYTLQRARALSFKNYIFIFFFSLSLCCTQLDSFPASSVSYLFRWVAFFLYFLARWRRMHRTYTHTCVPRSRLLVFFIFTFCPYLFIKVPLCIECRLFLLYKYTAAS